MFQLGTQNEGICLTFILHIIISLMIKLLSRTIPVPLESCLQTCTTYTSAKCTVNKLLTMGRGTARNMRSFMPE